MKKKNNLKLVPSSICSEELSVRFQKFIVPRVALTKAHIVIVYIFYINTVQTGDFGNSRTIRRVLRDEHCIERK